VSFRHLRSSARATEDGGFRGERQGDHGTPIPVDLTSISETVKRTRDHRSLSDAGLLGLQRSVGNRIIARLLLAPRRVDPIPPDGRPGTIRRWFDEDTWELPKEEKTFKGWLDVYWEHPDWISQDAYEEVERLYGLLLKAQGEKEPAVAAHDAAYYAWEASYLVPDSDAWKRAVSSAADEIEGADGVADAEAIQAKWPGRERDDVPEEYTQAVGDEVQNRAVAKKRALADKKEADRQKAAATAKEIRDRQTRRIWTGRQVIRMTGYGGTTSIHPYWGGRNLMINQRNGYHFTQFQDNYDPNKEFGEGTDIQTVIDAVFGGKGGENCLHVTQELFGPKDKRNPHYFVSGIYKVATEKSNKVKEKSQGELAELMDSEKQRIRNLLRLETQ
jgi:hypothetical protein